MKNYKGNRWFKCDLHLHTRASKCFQDQSVTPKQWVDRAIAMGIDCVAVTDHNTGSSIDEIKKAAHDTSLTVFPGVEITCDTSKIHLLILFDVSKSTSDIEDFLIKADIKRKDFGEEEGTTIKNIFDIAELANKDGALVIPAHIDEYNGLGSLGVDNLKKFYKLENINAVQVVHEKFTDKNLKTIGNSELKKYLKNYYSEPTPSIDDSTIKEWFTPVKYAYESNLAILTFSDNPHEPNNSKHGLYGIGTRYTWIKMDEVPTLEGLRQAFLLPKFRIKNDFEATKTPFETPSLWIKSLKVYNNTIVKKEIPFEIEFNPQLNSIIGGRGSGKSSILRFIRGVFNNTEEIRSIHEVLNDHLSFYKKEEGKPKKGVFSEDSTIEIEFIRNQILHKILAKNINSSSEQDILIMRFDESLNNWIEIEDVGYINFFNFEHYSQKQIYEIAQEPNALREIIDRSIDGIAYLKDEREYTKKLFLEKSAKIRSAEQLIKNKGQKETILKDLKIRIDAFQKSGIAQLLNTKEKFTDQGKVIRSLIDELISKEKLLESLIEQIEISDIDYSKFENDYKIELQTISKNIITKFDNIKEELQLIKDTIVGLKSEYIVSIKNSNWNTDFEKNNIEFNVQKEELEKKGVNDILNFENLKNEKLIIEADLEKIYTEEKLKDKNIIDRSNFQIDYLKKCKEITQKRCDFLNKTFNDSNIKINVKPLRDKLDFENKLRNIINPSDSRGAYINSDIEYLKEISFNGNIEQKIKDFRSVFSSLKKGENVQNITGYFKNLVASLNDAQIDELEILLPEDEIEVQYKPEGSSNFKSLSTASAGQKTTAILTFILSYGNNPLILDQPEDDIDNKHVYELIVERLRQTKEKRQIIVVTHNANIPVNGDAEYIISMNSESKYLEVLHCGTVEQPNIKKEICDVMEGSEKAFIMRSMRYKFIQ